MPGTHHLQDLKHDVRYGLRMLAKQPLSTLLVLLTLALGIGAGSAIFSAVRGTLLHQLPYPNANELVMVWLDNTRLDIRTDITSYPNYVDTRDSSESLADLAVYRPTWATLTAASGEAAEPERLRASRISSNLLPLLGVRPARGRGFESAEDLEGSEPVVVLGHDLWQRRFGGDESVLDRTVDLDGESRRVVGIMPPGFDFPGDTDLWMSMAVSEGGQTSRRAFWLYQIGRLDGTSVAEAQAELDTIAVRLQEENEGLEGYGLYAQPLREHLVGDVKTPLLVLSAAVVFVLLIVCSNVANLLLARSAARRREVSLRLALGAGRGRLVRQLLTESVLLAGLGGLLGVAVAYFGLRGLIRFGPDDLTRLATPTLDLGALGFTLGLAVLTGVLVGLAPALGTSRRAAGNLASALQDGTRGSVGAFAGSWLRRGLVVIEVALAIVLLVGAGLLLRSFDRLLEVDLGFHTEGILAIDLSLPSSRYEAPGTIELYRALTERIAGLPDVQAVGLASDPLLPQLARSGNVTVEGVPDRPPEERIEITIDAVTNGYFDTVGIPLIAGRLFQPTDDLEAPGVALINEAMAKRYWQSAENAVGRRFDFGEAPESDEDWLTVIGVIGDARRTSFEAAARPSAYFAHSQFPMRSMTLLARVDQGDPKALVPTIRTLVRDADPNLPLAGVATLAAQVDERVAGRRFHTLLLAAFASLALFLAVVGVYGVISHLVGQRTGEIGVRMALGASRRDIAGWVLGQGLLPVVLGVILGLGGGAALARTLRSMLFEVGTLDPWTFLAVPALLLLVAALATLIPASRAVRVAPSEALRYE
ncbi:MAG: ABC transporter permease [Thermoanaerobaculia bacterium]|nr:ABC transporter permease [Thermoanaerobaculia bacterium]